MRQNENWPYFAWGVKQGLEPIGGQHMRHWRGQRDCQITDTLPAMNSLTLFGACAVAIMLLAYALEQRSPWWILVIRRSAASKVHAARYTKATVGEKALQSTPARALATILPKLSREEYTPSYHWKVKGRRRFYAPLTFS